MNQIGPIISSSANVGLMYAERILKGIPSDLFARLARPGGVIIRSNHPAFVFGHLSLYPVRIMNAVGQPVGPTAFPSGYEGLFKSGVECRDDPENSIYPSMTDLTTFFFTAYRAATQAAAAASDEAFAKPNPAEGRLRELFPTIGTALNFYLGGHVQNHLGQISTWRRAIGLPAA